MATFGHLTLDPARNPAVLDTASWAPEGLVSGLMQSPAREWEEACLGLRRGPWPGRAGPFRFGVPGTRPGTGSCWAVARHADGQQALALFRPGGEPSAGPGPVLASRTLAGGWAVDLLPADLTTVESFLRTLAPGCGPQVLGPVPRLGIGTRMTTAVWPGVWDALARRRFAANAIQNSVRELNLLGDLIAGVPPRENYLHGLGRLEEGHTGSTFEGLWLAGVLSALAAGVREPFGADADHIMVKRTPDGLDRARAVIAAARCYTFFTLDVSDLLDYGAGVSGSPADAQARFEKAVPDPAQRREVLAWHAAGREGIPALSPCDAARAAARFWHALAAAEALTAEIRCRRRGLPFDLELSLDEVPAGVSVGDALTTPDEAAFLLGEFRRRGLPVTHLAPNLGIEKGTDYRLPDGLPGLARRVQTLQRLLAGAGVMLDCHSGDDLSAATRRAIGRAAGGRVHFKISPCLQWLFAEVLETEAPAVFRFWWDDTLAGLARAAEAGSVPAAGLLREAAAAVPSARHPAFRQYCFATVGRRSAAGGFLHRDVFYTLPESFYSACAARVAGLLLDTAGDLWGEG